MVVLVLRMSPADNPSGSIEENGGLGERRDVSLCESSSGTGAFVHIALTPGSDSSGSTCEECGSVGADSDRNIVELDVVED